MAQNIWGPADPFKVKATDIKALGQPKAIAPEDKTLEVATAIGEGLSALYESDFGQKATGYVGDLVGDAWDYASDATYDFLGSETDTWGSRELKTLDTQLAAMDKHKPKVEGDERNKWQQNRNHLADRRNYLVNSDQYKTKEDVVYGKPNWFDDLVENKGVKEGISVFDNYTPTQDFFGDNTGKIQVHHANGSSAWITPDMVQLYRGQGFYPSTNSAGSNSAGSNG